MKLVYVHNGTDLYGASRSLLRLVTRQLSEGHQVTVVLPYDGMLKQRLDSLGAEILIDARLPLLQRSAFRNPFHIVPLLIDALRCSSAAKRWLVRNRPDLVHTNTGAMVPAWGAAARKTGIPHVVHVRESFQEFGVFWTVFQRLLAYNADMVISVSRSMADQFASCFQEKIKVLHNGFPASEFDPVPAERVQAFKDRFGLNHVLLIGLVGRIKLVRKGQDVFVRAAARLKDRFPGARYVVMGSPFPGNEEHLAALKRLIDEQGVGDCVVLTGDVEDIKAGTAAMDVAIMASGQPEPFGGVVIEAMALGRPVVGTAIGGTLEQVENGVTGFLVPPNDDKALADAIGRLLEDPALRRTMGERARQAFLAKFEFEPFYAALWREYNALVPNREGPRT
ncbi:MAG: glycosyltransferase family 4 protein [bacterium]